MKMKYFQREIEVQAWKYSKPMLEQGIPLFITSNKNIRLWAANDRLTGYIITDNFNNRREIHEDDWIVYYEHYNRWMIVNPADFEFLYKTQITDVDAGEIFVKRALMLKSSPEAIRRDLKSVFPDYMESGVFKLSVFQTNVFSSRPDKTYPTAILEYSHPVFGQTFFLDGGVLYELNDGCVIYSSGSDIINSYSNTLN